MKIKFKISCAVDRNFYNSDDVAEVSNKFGNDMIKAGFADVVVDRNKNSSNNRAGSKKSAKRQSKA